MGKISFSLDLEEEDKKEPDLVDVNSLKEGKNKIVTCQEGLTLWAYVKGPHIVEWSVTDKDNKPLDTMVIYPHARDNVLFFHAADAGTVDDGGTPPKPKVCGYVCASFASGPRCWKVCDFQ
jgi:hypothetical protein